MTHWLQYFQHVSPVVVAHGLVDHTGSCVLAHELLVAPQ